LQEDYLQLETANGIHQIKSHDGHLWVVNTGEDSILKISEGQVVETIRLQDLGDTVTGLLRGPSRERAWGKNKLHTNSIAWLPNGDMLLLFMSAGCIYNYTQRKVVSYAQHWKLAHDLCVINDSHLLISVSNDAAIDVVNCGEGNILRGEFSNPIRNDNVSSSQLGFLRGIAQHQRSGDIFVASAPGTVFRIKLDTWKIIDSMEFSQKLNGCPYDLLLNPRDWS
jgi:hypothetical protein